MRNVCTIASLGSDSYLYNFSCVSLIDNGSQNKIICISSDYCTLRKCFSNLVCSEAVVAYISEFHCIVEPYKRSVGFPTSFLSTTYF